MNNLKRITLSLGLLLSTTSFANWPYETYNINPRVYDTIGSGEEFRQDCRSRKSDMQKKVRAAYAEFVEEVRNTEGAELGHRSRPSCSHSIENVYDPLSAYGLKARDLEKRCSIYCRGRVKVRFEDWQARNTVDDLFREIYIKPVDPSLIVKLPGSSLDEPSSDDEDED